MINYELMAERVFDLTQFNGKIAVILGSGLGGFSNNLKNQCTIPYNDIPGYPLSTVEGHEGELVLGTLDKQELLIAKGRFHYYEGYSFQEITIPIHLFSKLGIDHLIITNSSGSMNKNFLPGSLMVVKGHMDCTYRHSPDRPKLYSGLPYHDSQLIDLALASGKEMGIKLELGNYCWTLGPSYETPAEIIDMKNFGGDAVGMSTVPEIISAAELNMRVLTISCLTNYAAGITKKSLSHEEVMETAKKSSKEFSQLLKKILSNLFDSF